MYNKVKYAAFRGKALEADPVHREASSVGGRYFRDTFEGYLRQRSLDDMEVSARSSFALPASDRVVFLGDNGPEVIDDIQKLREAVRSYNDEDGKLVDRRERLDSELSAGQELLKAPTVRVKAVAAVLLSTLGFIASEFAGGIIGELAVKLIEQLRPLLGL